MTNDDEQWMTMAASVTSSQTISPIGYLIFLTICLLIYLAYLILPRGLRHHICGTKRRYRRQNAICKSSSSPGRIGALPSSRAVNNSNHTSRLGIVSTDQYWGVPYDSWSAPTHAIEPTFGRGESWTSPLDGTIDSNENRLQQSLTQPPGIKMIAHGTKCNPRIVYITLHFNDVQQQLMQSVPSLEYQNCLTWRAELRKSNSTIGLNNNLTLKLGNLRRVSFEDILGIQRGKVTTALRRMQTANVVDSDMCFSLLTKSGTLDLQCCNVDIMPAVQVRECFIDLLGRALALRGMALNEPYVGIGSSGFMSGGAVGSQMNANIGGGGGGIGNAAAASITINRTSNHISGGYDAGGDSQSGPSPAGDANLSVISF